MSESANSTPAVTGGCFCGAIRYEFTAGDYPAANCHCSMCRRISGAPYVAWVVVPQANFHFRAGTPAELQSSERGKRYFCARCGTHLACVIAAHPDIIDVTIGSLDHPEQFAPRFDIHTDTRLPWVPRSQ
jgi:hypothetical protein